MKAAWMQLWRDRDTVWQVAWLPVLLSFGLVALSKFMPHIKQPCRFAEEALFAVLAVAIFRNDLLGEAPAIRRIARIAFYFSFGTREISYALWMMALMLFALAVGQVASVAENVPLIGWLVAKQIWPLFRDMLTAMLFLVAPYIAVAKKPAIAKIPGLMEALIGNIIHVMVAVFVIFLPYYLMAAAGDYIKGPPAILHNAWRLTEHAVFCLCLLTQIKFAAAVYRNYAPGVSRPR